MAIDAVFYGLTLVVAFFALIAIVIYTVKNGISPMPTGLRVRRSLLNAMAELEPAGLVVDLGSAWGTLALSVARRFPMCRVLGYENSPVPFAVARLLQVVCSTDGLKFERRDFFDVSFEDADGVICYLYSGAMARLKSKFESELRPGAWVVSHTFAVPDWKPEREVVVDDLYRTKIYVYRIKSP